MDNSTGIERNEMTESTPDKLRTGVNIDRSNRTATLIEDAIREGGGRIPYSKFMDISLFGPEGYYSSAKARIGRDFITAPELSEHFGATIGKSTMKVWEAMGKPKEGFRIVEMGAGNGALAKDLLVWAQQHEPEFYEALSYTIVEYGDLIQNQQKTMEGKGRWARGARRRMNPPAKYETGLEKVTWVQGSASELPLRDIEGVLISNELPDAFPVEIVKKVGGQVKQKFITLENDEWVEKWEDPSDDVQAYIADYEIGIEEGIEEPINLNAVQWQQNVDRTLKRGAVITIDYGRHGTVGAMSEETNATRTYPAKIQKVTRTFPAETNREYESPGKVDITTDVNFKVLGQVAERDGLVETFADTQAAFLLQNGFSEFVQPTINALRQTRSLKKIRELDIELGMHKKVFEDDFFAQVLTKGIDWGASTETPSPAEVFNSGVRLNLGKPNARFYIRYEWESGVGKALTEIETDDEGYFSFPTFWGPSLSAFFGADAESSERYVVRDSGSNGVILDTKDQDALRQIVVRSGYEYDLAA